MIRTIISLNENEKKWLDQMSKIKHVPMAAIIREAIQEYRRTHSDRMKTDLDSLLEQTRGIWRGEDGLTYQSNIRDEWDESL